MSQSGKSLTQTRRGGVFTVPKAAHPIMVQLLPSGMLNFLKKNHGFTEENTPLHMTIDPEFLKTYTYDYTQI